MGYIEMLFEETMDRVKAELETVKEIDVVIGIPFYNEVDTLKNTVSVEKGSLKTK